MKSHIPFNAVLLWVLVNLISFNFIFKKFKKNIIFYINFIAAWSPKTYLLAFAGEDKN